MASNTNLDEASFPVGFVNVFVKGMIEGEYSLPVIISLEKYYGIASAKLIFSNMPFSAQQNQVLILQR